jgi:hypothetical protein
MLNNILQRQLQAFQLQGNKEYPMVTLKNIYNSLAKIIEEAGLKNVENYFVNPDQGKQMVNLHHHHQHQLKKLNLLE